MVAITNLLFAATAALAAVLPRDAATILADLKTINSDTQALTTAVKNWDGTTGGAIPIANAESTLENKIKSTTTDANNSGVASETDANSIINYINTTLEPSVAASIKQLEARKAQFQSSGLYSTVQNDLKNLKSETDSLGTALKAKAPSDKQSAAQAAINKIDSDFAGAISAFS